MLAGANTRMIGPSLDNSDARLHRRDAAPARPLASDYADADWMSGTYTLDGQEIFALIHAEYHGSSTRATAASTFPKCRYNAVTYRALHEQRRPVRATARRRATWWRRSLPVRARRRALRLLRPSNIIEKDGWYYNMHPRLGGVQRAARRRLPDAHAGPRATRSRGARGTATGFNVQFIDPYRESRRADRQPRVRAGVAAADRRAQPRRSPTTRSSTSTSWSGTTTKYEPSVGRPDRRASTTRRPTTSSTGPTGSS